jgi:hypothetical protein
LPKLNLEGNLLLQLQCRNIRDAAGDSLGIMAQKKRGRLRPGQDAVIAFADDRHGAARRQYGAKPIGGDVDFERLELAGLLLQPKLGGRDLVDEARIAGVGFVGEINLGESARLRRRQDAHE